MERMERRVRVHERSECQRDSAQQVIKVATEIRPSPNLLPEERDLLIGWLLMNAVIVSAVRTAVGKAPKGKLSGTRPDDMAAAAIRAAVERVSGLEPAEIDDVYLGCAI